MFAQRLMRQVEAASERVYADHHEDLLATEKQLAKDVEDLIDSQANYMRLCRGESDKAKARSHRETATALFLQRLDKERVLRDLRRMLKRSARAYRLFGAAPV